MGSSDSVVVIPELSLTCQGIEMFHLLVTKHNQAKYCLFIYLFYLFIYYVVAKTWTQILNGKAAKTCCLPY